MDLAVFAPNELVPVLRALKNVAHSNGVFTDAERALLEGVARIHGQEVDIDSLFPIAVDDLAKQLLDPHRRKRAVQLAIVTALVEGEPEESVERSVRDLARALAIDEQGLAVLCDLAGGHSLIARLDMFQRVRRSVIGDEGLPGILRMVLPVIGIGLDPVVAARFHALAKSPANTFGHAFYAHIRESKFAFPGEKGGFPEDKIFHDAGHVLSGYGVDPVGEIQQAAFQAGFMRRDGFVFLLFGILQFHLGLRITPIAKGEIGLFDTAKVIRAAERGSKCSVDLSENWPFWDVADVPLDELRARYGIPAA